MTRRRTRPSDRHRSAATAARAHSVTSQAAYHRGDPVRLMTEVLSGAADVKIPNGTKRRNHRVQAAGAVSLLLKAPRTPIVHTTIASTSTAKAPRKPHHRPAATPSRVPPTAATTELPTSTAAMSACENVPYIHSGTASAAGLTPKWITSHSEAIRA